MIPKWKVGSFLWLFFARRDIETYMFSMRDGEFTPSKRTKGKTMNTNTTTTIRQFVEHGEFVCGESWSFYVVRSAVDGTWTAGAYPADPGNDSWKIVSLHDKHWISDADEANEAIQEFIETIEKWDDEEDIRIAIHHIQNACDRLKDRLFYCIEEEDE